MSARQRMFSPLRAVPPSGRCCAPACPRRPGRETTASCPPRWPPAAAASDDPRRSARCAVRRRRRGSRGPPRAAVDDHLARRALVGHEIEAHQSAVQAETIAAGTFAFADARRGEARQRSIQRPCALERRPAFAFERERTAGSKRAVKNPNVSGVDGNVTDAARRIECARRTTVTRPIARIRRIGATGGCVSPWHQWTFIGAGAGDHPRDPALVFTIRLAESPLEHRLLDQRNVDQVDREKGQHPLEVWPRQQHERLTDEDKHHAGDHRVADVAVRADDDELRRRVPRRQRAPAVDDEVVERCDEQRQPDDERDQAGELDQDCGRRVAHGRRGRRSLSQPPWDQNGHREGEHGDGKKVSHPHRRNCGDNPRHRGTVPVSECLRGTVPVTEGQSPSFGRPRPQP